MNKKSTSSVSNLSKSGSKKVTSKVRKTSKKSREKSIGNTANSTMRFGGT